MTGEWIIRINKLYFAFVLVAASAFTTGFAGHAWWTASTPLVQAQPAAIPAETANERLDISVDDDPALGPADAPVTLVSFSDYACPFCKRFRDQTMDRLLQAYEGRLRFVFRDYPLRGAHPTAQLAAESAECADDQGLFWEMHDLLFEGQAAWTVAPDAAAVFKTYAHELRLDLGRFSECLDSGKYADEVEHDLGQGFLYGVRGTPAFFVNGRPIVGAVPFEMLADLIEQELTASRP